VAVLAPSGVCGEGLSPAAGEQQLEQVRYRSGPNSRLTAEVSARITALVEVQPDVTVAELRQWLAIENGAAMSWLMVRLSVGQFVCSSKKSIHGLDRDTEANRMRRAKFLEQIRVVPPERKRLVLAFLMRCVRVMYPHSAMWIHDLRSDLGARRSIDALYDLRFRSNELSGCVVFISSVRAVGFCRVSFDN
jgi:hypothetical protein